MKNTTRSLYAWVGILLALVITVMAVGCQPTAPASPENGGTSSSVTGDGTTSTTKADEVQVPDNWSNVQEDDTDGVTTTSSTTVPTLEPSQSTDSTTQASTTKGDGWLPGYY